MLTGCNSDEASDNENSTKLNPDVQPITDGDWYRPSTSVTWQWQLEREASISHMQWKYTI